MIIETELSLPEKKSSNNFLQIDILKGFMIMLVIIDHAIPTSVRAEWGHSLWERISIPVFLIIMGFNAANSFKKRDVPLSSLKLFLSYCWQKFKRYIIPFAFLYILSTIIGLIKYGGFESLLQNQYDGHWSRESLWDLILPFYGPGNWFIPVLVSSAIVMPFLYYGYRKNPKLTLFLSVLWEVGIQYFVFSYYGHWTAWWPNFPIGRTRLQLSIFFYLNTLVLGFWFSDHKGICSSQSEIPEDLNHIKTYELTNKETQEEPKDDIQEDTQEEPKKISQKIIKILNKIWEYNFYIVLFSSILISTTILMPAIALSGGQAQATGFTIGLIFIIIGLYFYRPLSEFLVVFIVAVTMVGFFFLTLALYGNSAYINYERMTVEPAVFLFFVNIVIFILPYLVNVYYNARNKNWFIWVLFMMSVTYLILYQYEEFRFLLLTGDYHFFVYPYSAFIVLIFLKIIPKKSNFFLLRGFAYIGKASYHILLTQIFVYGLMLSTFGEHYFQGALQAQYLSNPAQYNGAVWIYVIIMWLICIPIGIVWYLIEKKVFSYFKQRKKGKEQIQ
jgi:peptidoglycan/LPS O-acetylase OafA/YrhL